MKLTPRLQAIADQIPAGSVVADIGTDHAYIPVYLLKNRLSSHVIASDSRSGPLQAAAETFHLFNLSQAADLRLGNGLRVLTYEDKVDVAVLAGMGGETICAILDDGHQILGFGARLVLQPMTETDTVRKWLLANGFYIVQEDIAQEEKNFYEIIVAQRMASGGRDELSLLEIGPLLFACRHPLLRPMLEQRAERLRAAAAKARASDSLAARDRTRDLEARLKFLEEVLSWL